MNSNINNTALIRLRTVTETLQKANGCYHTWCFFQFLMSLTVTMKILAFKAYNMISETEKKLKQLRDKNDVVFKRWHANTVEISSGLGTKPSAPRTASRQQHRANAPHDTAEEYYRRNLFIPFLDHITQEMSSR